MFSLSGKEQPRTFFTQDSCQSLDAILENYFNATVMVLIMSWGGYDDGRGWEEEIGRSCVGVHRENGNGVDAGRDRVPPPVVVAWLELGSLPKPNFFGQNFLSPL